MITVKALLGEVFVIIKYSPKNLRGWCGVMFVKIVSTAGLLFNISGVIGLAFGVKEITVVGGGAVPIDPKEQQKKKLFYLLIILGFILQLSGVWL